MGLFRVSGLEHELEKSKPTHEQVPSWEVIKMQLHIPHWDWKAEVGKTNMLNSDPSSWFDRHLTNQESSFQTDQGARPDLTV